MDLMLLLHNQSCDQSYMHPTYNGEKIGVKPSSPLEDALAFLVDIDSRSYSLRGSLPVVTLVVH